MSSQDKPGAPKRKATTAGKKTTEETTAKKAAAKKTTVKKDATKKPAVSETAAKKSAVEKTPARTRATRKSAPREPEAPPVAAAAQPLPGSGAQPVALPGPPPIPLPSVPPPPQGYGRDKIVVLVRDPGCIFTYWDLTGDAFGQVVRARGAAFVNRCHWALRVHNHTEGSHRLLEVTVEAGNWYIDAHPGKSYSVEIGLVAPDGTFVPIATSKRVTTPRDSVSDRIDEEWVVTDEEFERMFDLSGGNRTIGASESISSIGVQKMRERIALQLKQAMASRRK